MRYLTLNEVLELHGQIISQSGGTPGLLTLNGFEIRAPVDEQEQIVLHVAAGDLERDNFTPRLKAHIIPRG